MSEHKATISWKRTSPDFLKGRYSREHTGMFDGDATTPGWTNDLALYDPGEIFRFFQDEDGDGCNDRFTEPQTPVRQLWEHGQVTPWDPARDALEAYNNAATGTANDAAFVSLWFPLTATAYAQPEFGSYGPGQGDSPGQKT